MSKYLKQFETNSEYETYINGNNKILPNVSITEQENDVHYTPEYVSFKGILHASGDIDPNIGAWFNFPYEEISEIEKLRKRFPFLKKDGEMVDYEQLCNKFGSITTESITDLCTFEWVVPYDRLMRVGIINDFVGDEYGYTFPSCMFKEITIPYQITEIGNGGFSGCDSCEKINLENIKTFGENAFLSLNHFSTSGFYYYQVKQIECLNLKSAEEIGDYAFQGCSAKKIIIGENIKTIGYGSFMVVASKTIIINGNSIESIGNQAFYECNDAEIIINAEEPPTLGEYAFHKNGPVVNNRYTKILNEDIKIYVPSTSVATYKAATGWNTYADYIFPIQ